MSEPWIDARFEVNQLANHFTGPDDAYRYYLPVYIVMASSLSKKLDRIRSG
jgi:hypothetical protein